MIKISNIGNSFAYMQKIIRQSGPAMGASYSLIAAVMIFGGIGYFIDSIKNSSPIFLLSGLSLGIIIGFYEIAKIIWLKKK